jgi:hypothetical protein
LLPRIIQGLHGHAVRSDHNPFALPNVCPSPEGVKYFGSETVFMTPCNETDSGSIFCGDGNNLVIGQFIKASDNTFYMRSFEFFDKDFDKNLLRHIILLGRCSKL